MTVVTPDTFWQMIYDLVTEGWDEAEAYCCISENYTTELE